MTPHHQKPVDRMMPSYVSVQLISLSYDDGERGFPANRGRERGMGGRRMTLPHYPFSACVGDSGGPTETGLLCVRPENGGKLLSHSSFPHQYAAGYNTLV
jgi:hypothetical protein